MGEFPFQFTSVHRLGLMVLGIVLGNLGRLVIGGWLGSIVVWVGALSSLTALGAAEFVWWLLSKATDRFKTAA